MFIHVYALMYLIGIAMAVIITRRRWRAAAGDPDLVRDVALWGARRDHRRPGLFRHHHADGHPARVVRHVRRVDGGLGISGAIAIAGPAGAWRVRQHGGDVALFMDTVAPAL